MDAGAVGPREPEQANGNEDGAKDGGRQTSLGSSISIRRLGGSLDVSVVVKNGSNGGNGHTNGNTKEGETTDTRAPATALLENNGESGEAHVEGAVDDGHVERDEEDNGLLEKKLPGSQKGNTELVANGLGRLALLKLGNVNLAGLLAQSSSALAKQDGGICLGVGQSAGNPDDTGEDGDQSFNPSPAFRLAKETTGNRTYSHLSARHTTWLSWKWGYSLTKSWAQEGSHGEDTEGNSSLLGLEQIGNDTTGVGQGRGSKGTGKESEDDESSHGVAAGGSSAESSQAHVTDEEGLLATVELRERSPEKWSNGEAHDEQ